MIAFWVGGQRCLISDEDAWSLDHAFCLDKNGYVTFTIKHKTNRLHRLIMNCPDDMEVDHIDGNRRNNQRDNLRICSHSQNHFNKGKSVNKYNRNTSIFKGVGRGRNGTKWRARIKIDGKEVSLGQYFTEEEAARIYDNKAIELFGEFAKLNFPRTA